MIGVLFPFFLYGGSIPSREKLEVSFFILEKTFFLDNRLKLDAERNTAIFPLAEATANAALDYFPEDSELKISSLRTLYVQGNYYLRHEKFALAHSKLWKAKKIIEKYLSYKGLSIHEICKELCFHDPRLPSIYAMILYHLALVPIHDFENAFSFNEAFEYLKKAIEIQEFIDPFPDRFFKLSDNNKEVGDLAIFKRTLIYIYIHQNELDEAEKLCFELLKIKDDFNQLTIHRMLFEIYQKKGQNISDHYGRIYFYEKSKKYVELCLKTLEIDQKERLRSSSVLKGIGSFFADPLNPFQDLIEAERILLLAKMKSEHLPLTSMEISKQLNLVFQARSQLELERYSKMHMEKVENENISSLRHLDDLHIHIRNYEALGDLFLEKGLLPVASTLYRHAIALNQKAQRMICMERLYHKIAHLEEMCVEKYLKCTFKSSSISYQELIESYNNNFTGLREKAKKLLEEGELIENIYQLLNESYKSFLERIFNDLIIALGEPPAERFVFLFFGSIGHGYNTPYSDIEYAILLDQESLEAKSYFKTLSELFHIRIAALGETPISYFYDSTFSWPKEIQSPLATGVALDRGKLFPHFDFNGFFCLGTPQQVAEAFSSENAFSLSKKKSCMFTFSTINENQELTDQFKKAIDAHWSQDKTCRDEIVRKLIELDFDQYYQNLNHYWIEQPDYYAVKFNFYRPLMNLLDAWAIKENLHEKSPWETVRKLYQTQKIDLQSRSAYLFLIDKIGEFRLKTYLTHGEQKETAYTDTSREPCLEKNEVLSILEALLYLQEKLRQALII